MDDKKLEKVVSQFGEKYGLDWTSLIEMVMTFLADCNLSRGQLVSAIKRPNFFQRAAATRELTLHIQHTKRTTRLRAHRMAQEVMDDASQLEPEVVGEFIDKCCDPSRWE